VRFATFTFDGTDAPLSRAMNDAQKRAIPDGWEYFVRKNEKTSAGYITLDTQSTDCATQERSGPY